MAAKTGPRPPSTPPVTPRLAVIGTNSSDDRLADCLADVIVDRFDDAEGVKFSRYDAVLYLLGGEDTNVRRAAAVHSGWIRPDPAGAADLEPLARRSRGVIVGTAQEWATVRLRLDPLAAVPPVVVLAGTTPGDVVERLIEDPLHSR